MKPLRDVIESLIVDAWQDETPTAELAQMDDLMARIAREKVEARRAGWDAALAAVRDARAILDRLASGPQ